MNNEELTKQIKVTRDRLMTNLSRRYPTFAWERNRGYETRSHVEGLLAGGPCVHHRRTFLVKALGVAEPQMDLALDGFLEGEADFGEMPAEV